MEISTQKLLISLKSRLTWLEKTKKSDFCMIHEKKANFYVKILFWGPPFTRYMSKLHYFDDSISGKQRFDCKIVKQLEKLNFPSISLSPKSIFSESLFCSPLMFPQGTTKHKNCFWLIQQILWLNKRLSFGIGFLYLTRISLFIKTRTNIVILETQYPNIYP